jgi:hypothetical protein
MTPIEIPSGHRANIYDGGFEAELRDPAMDLQTIVKEGTGFPVVARWYIQGNAATIGQYIQAGNNWRLQVVYEQLGGPKDNVLDATPSTLPFTTNTLVGSRYEFTDEVPVPATELTVPAGRTQTAYHLTALLTGENTTGPFLAASYDLGVIQVVK